MLNPAMHRYEVGCDVTYSTGLILALPLLVEATDPDHACWMTTELIEMSRTAAWQQGMKVWPVSVTIYLCSLVPTTTP